MKNWRYTHLPKHILPFKHIYQFGVYNGDSIIDLIESFTENHLPLVQIFGFDSFKGIPKDPYEKVINEDWFEGRWNAQKYFQIDDVGIIIDRVYQRIRQHTNNKPIDILLIKGWFKDLKNELVDRYDMKPAMYIDIDCDIYSSTLEALDFMCRNKLVVKNTVIAYDDWGGTNDWKTFGSGESRAHKEIQEKYNIDFELLEQFGDQTPYVRTFYKVRSI